MNHPVRPPLVTLLCATWLSPAWACVSSEGSAEAARGDAPTGEGEGEGDDDDGGSIRAEGVLQNYATGCEVEALNPELPAEQDFYALEAFTPSQAFTVGSVRYALINDGAQCDATLAHDLLIFPFTDGAPLARPSTSSALRVFTVDADPARTQPVLSLTAELATPLTLQPGERLGVAVRLRGDDDGHSLCLGMCTERAGAGLSFWSSAAVEPYAWVDLVTTFDLGNLLIEAVAP